MSKAWDGYRVKHGMTKQTWYNGERRYDRIGFSRSKILSRVSNMCDSVASHIVELLKIENALERES